jgi:predicted Zn-dependent protease
VEDEAQVAAVLAHEISHVIHRHVVQGFRNLKQTAAFASTLAVVSAPAGLYGLGALALGTIGAMASISGYSQSLEEEADKKGLDLMVRAGYDPREAVKVFDKVKRYVEQEEIKEPYFFSTHPRLEERKESYERLLNVQYGERGGFTGTQEFMSKVAPVLLDNSLLELARGRFALAEASIEIFLGMEPGNPRARFALAELLRQRNQEGDQEKAEKDYKLAIAHDASFADPHRGLGLLYYKKAETELSRTYLQKYLSLNPAAKDKAYIEQYLEQLKTKREQP